MSTQKAQRGSSTGQRGHLVATLGEDGRAEPIRRVHIDTKTGSQQSAEHEIFGKPASASGLESGFDDYLVDNGAIDNGWIHLCPYHEEK